MPLFRRGSHKKWEKYLHDAREASERLPEDAAHLARALEHFFSTPPPGPDTALDELNLLAVDVEATGLDVSTDRLLSVAMVSVNARSVPLGSAEHWLIQQDEGADSVGESATIHGITDDQLREGHDLVDVISSVISACAGRALLAHLAIIERDFISHVCEEVTGIPWDPAAVVDTMDLERRSAVSFGRRPGRGEVRLMNARHSRGLPDYHNHDALVDALACAELYLAQTAGDHFGRHLGDIQRKRGTSRW